MASLAPSAKVRVYLDLTHLGRHVTGIERVSIEQFEKVAFDDADLVPVRSNGLLSMIWRQQVLLPLLALLRPSARFIFPGFPPSPLFALARRRVYMYVHDTFLITRRADLSTKARLYMAPQFAIAVRRLKNFLVNSEKTAADLAIHVAADAHIALYRPAVGNVFGLDAARRMTAPRRDGPLRLVTLGTIEPRKNYAAAAAILDHLQTTIPGGAELHIIGRSGWGEDGERIARHRGVTVHGYLPADDVRRILEDGDVYLCTSHDEGLGLPLLEAQFAGLPVVAPDQPVFREVLGTSGVFIDPSQPMAAADQISALMASAEQRAVHADKARANVGRWNAIARGDLAAAQRIFASDAVHELDSVRLDAG